MEREKQVPDIFGMSPEFYRFEILNALVLIIVGIVLLAITALDIVHIFIGIGLLALMAGTSSVASSINYIRNRSEGELQKAVARTYKYRLATAVICFIAGGALLVAYLIR